MFKSVWLGQKVEQTISRASRCSQTKEASLGVWKKKKEGLLGQVWEYRIPIPRIIQTHT